MDKKDVDKESEVVDFAAWKRRMLEEAKVEEI